MFCLVLRNNLIRNGNAILLASYTKNIGVTVAIAVNCFIVL